MSKGLTDRDRAIIQQIILGRWSPLRLRTRKNRSSVHDVISYYKVYIVVVLFRVAFHSLHPALDRLSRYYNTLSELDDRNAVTVDDQEKAKAVADWIERMALEQKVTTCAELVELLRKRST